MRALQAAVVGILVGAGALAPAESARPFPYEEWNGLLQKYVSSDGRVDYRALKGNAGDLATLDKLQAAVATNGPTLNPGEFKNRWDKLAFYINAYNISVWKNVLNRLPKLTNVDKEKVSFFYSTKFTVDGKSINLRDLEGDIIRPQFKDARVHMALNCASGGCPQLPNYAFTPARLDQQLSAETRKFINEARNVSYDPSTKELRLSHIFDWYKEDFGREPAKVIAWINTYREATAKLPSDVKIKHVDYDWTLNDTQLLKR